MLDQLRGMQLAVEAPAREELLVRVAGRLTGETGPRLQRLLEELSSRDGDPRRRPSRMVVDLHNVWVFDRDGIAVLERARLAAGRRGVRLVLGGVDAARLELLPQRVEQSLRRLGTVGAPAAGRSGSGVTSN
jgi:anti-anti-sigma regulatory factor